MRRLRLFRQVHTIFAGRSGSAAISRRSAKTTATDNANTGKEHDPKPARVRPTNRLRTVLKQLEKHPWLLSFRV